jgi:multimeric flavodoxin WrbA
MAIKRIKALSFFAFLPYYSFMPKKILILNGSPKKDGNTAAMADWFGQGARSKGADVEIVRTAYLKYKTLGCISCRKCQTSEKYECCIDDEAKPVLAKMAVVDVIVMATPLYFFGASAQLKLIFDRMFSLYKWDNDAGTMQTPLKGKTLVLLASAFEDVGLDALEKPFALTAEYTGMKFESILAANAGVSGEIAKKRPDIRDKVMLLGIKMAQ